MTRSSGSCARPGLRLDDFFTDDAGLFGLARVAALACPPMELTASARWWPAAPRASGEATARELTARGARVAVVDLDGERAAALAASSAAPFVRPT